MKLKTVRCGNCDKEITKDKNLINYQLKISKRGSLFCSATCSSSRNDSIIDLVCASCGKEFKLRRWDYNRRKKTSKRKQVFCSPKCSLTGQVLSEETKQKISVAQKGVSVMSRGRKGRIIPEDVKEKIRRSKIGIPNKKDNDIILNDLKTRHYDKVITTIKVIPDAIMVKDGKLIALEVEKKKYEYDIRKKMKNYINDEFDIVIISWYLPNGEKVRDFIRENGIWN